MRNSRGVLKRLRLTALAVAGFLGGCEDAAVADPPAAGDPTRGARLLAQYHCGSCHTIPGVASARGQVAVTLESFGRRSYIGGRMPNTAQILVQWLIQPSSVIPDTTMPDMGVSEADAKDMAAYLGKLE